MLVTVVDRTRGAVSHEDCARVVAAVDRQVRRDVAPVLGVDARVRLAPASGRRPARAAIASRRGDAVLYLVADGDPGDAVGWHERDRRGVPYGFVSLALADALGEPWSVTLSHEALEMIADPEVNLLVLGPHPDRARRRRVLHWFEICDAVQDDRYEVDGVEVSDFVLPLWFTEAAEPGARNEFLPRRRRGRALASFTAAPGGYLGFYDPSTREHETWVAPGDARAEARRRARERFAWARRGSRRRPGPEAGAPPPPGAGSAA